MEFNHLDGRLWTPLRTKPRQEKKFSEYCNAHNVVCYLPLLRKIHRYGKRRMEFFLPMFPGYVFCCVNEEEYRALLLSNAVLYRVAIDEYRELRLIEELRTINIFELLVGKEEVIVRPELVRGTRVVFTKGPFQGVAGIVEHRKNKSIISVNIEILGHSASVEIDAEEVETT